jgi:hypothetical protein
MPASARTLDFRLQTQDFPTGNPAGSWPPSENRIPPTVVVRALGCRQPSPFQPPLKGCPRFFGNLLHHNLFG